MKATGDQPTPSLRETVLSNAEIADRLESLAQLLSAQKENPYKVKAYQRAAAKIRTLSESIDELVRDDADLTAFAGIGEAISGAIREIVRTGTLKKLETLRAEAIPELADISQHPRLDPKRVLRIYKKLGITSVEALKEKLASGDIENTLGRRMAEHVREGLTESHAMLLYRADDLRIAIQEFLLSKCAVRRAEAVGEYRRRVEVIEEIAFVIDTDDFERVISNLQRYGGRTMLVSSAKHHAVFALSSGISLRVHVAGKRDWGVGLVACTGSKAHLRKLTAVTGSLRTLRLHGRFPTETALYRKFGLPFIQPELREGHDEVERAVQNTLPDLVALKNIRGELHAHSKISRGGYPPRRIAGLPG
jgi:DNA polymerase (family 10)